MNPRIVLSSTLWLVAIGCASLALIFSGQRPAGAALGSGAILMHLFWLFNTGDSFIGDEVENKALEAKPCS